MLVVDDEAHFLASIQFILGRMGVECVDTCDDARRALDMFHGNIYTVVLLDISMPHVDGVTLLRQIKKKSPETPVIMITAVNEMETAVSCIKNGAFDYLLKPFEEERLSTSLNNAFELADARRENRSLHDQLVSGTLKNPEVFREFVTQNNTLLGIFSYIEAIGSSRQSVLITGETGTGKELIALALHDSSERSGSYIPINIAGVPENLIDDELFGHCAGAYTGAQSERAGMIEKAAGGTLFLDEIGDLPVVTQVKLLRLIQEQCYQRIGSDAFVNTDARIVVATNVDIKDRVSKGLFRTDLFYRLNTHHIHLPPLRDRKEDIPFLVDKFLGLAAEELGKKKPNVPSQLYTLLCTYGFPGNVRELRGMVFDAMSRHVSGTLSMESFRLRIQPDPCAEKSNNKLLSGNNEKKLRSTTIYPR